MVTSQKVVDPGESRRTTTDDGDEIESELFVSTREAGVACFPLPDLGFETEVDD